MSGTRVRRIAGLAAVTTALIAGTAHAATLQVRPNKPNALQKAIDKADPGDKLAVHRGRYKESVEVDKRLRIIGVSKVRPVVDATCDSEITIDVTHGGVRLRHLKARGAQFEATVSPGFTINFVGIPTGTVRDVAVQESCPGSAEYGINLTDTGNLRILDNHTYGGYTDAGIYVGNITDTRGKTLLVRGNISNGNNRGAIIEDSFLPAAEIVVHDNFLHHNNITGEGTPDGLFIRNSDGGRYIDNRANRNGKYGILVDATSDNNVFIGNTAINNGLAELDFVDNGMDNCGSGNSFPIDPC